MKYSLDTRNDYDPQFVKDASSTGVINRTLCIPHAVCEKLCTGNSIGRNCVYTGSCTHAVCFEHEKDKEDDNVQVDLSRVTLYGPNSTVKLVKPSNSNSSDDEVIAAIEPDTAKGYADAVRHAWDQCSARKISFHAAFDPSLAASAGAPHAPRTVGTDASVSLPFLDGADTLSHDTRQEMVQCRIFNTKFQGHDIEVIRNVTQCNLCNERTFSIADHIASIKYTVGTNENGTAVTETAQRLCIPTKTCEDKCGVLPKGCMYTGSCQSVFCLSALRSKRPVDFPFFSENGAINGFLVNDKVQNSEWESVLRNGRAQPLFVKDVDGKDGKVRGSETENSTWEEVQKMPKCSNQPLPGGAPEYGGGAGGILPEPTPTPAAERRR